MVSSRFMVFSCVMMILSATSKADEPGADFPGRAAVEKSLPLILRSVTEYGLHRDCFSCHHHAVPMLAATIARDHGFSVDKDVLDQIVDQTRDDLRGALKSYQSGQGQGGGATRAGYALFTLKAAGADPDETTAAVVSFLLSRDQREGRWRTTSDRPPSEASDFTTTYLAIEALREYGSKAEKDRIDDRIAKARKWLEETPGKSTEDQVFRLFGLHAVDADPATIETVAADLLRSQHEDGGWSQLADTPSDAYATGSVLVALQRSGRVSAADSAFQAGLKFLKESQQADGSWHVVSRSKPFQPYFESGFPHGKDQFISMAASSWATAALALGCPGRGEAAVQEPAAEATAP